MKKYVRQPEMIEAVKFIDTPENFVEINKFINERDGLGIYHAATQDTSAYWEIKSIVGMEPLDEGGYVIFNGFLFFCMSDPTVFEQLYEVA